jgi:uncharacterized protein (DUF1697 family)
MPTYVVLLRGVNVGKAKRVPMADFRQLLLGLGCTHATTLLNSGNAVVQHPRVASPTLAGRIAAALVDRFGFEVPVIVKSGTEFAQVVAGNPLTFDEADHARLLVALGQRPESLAPLAGLAPLLAPPERLQIREHAAYLHCAAGILQSQAATALLGPRGRAITTRNWATVLKLLALVNAGASGGGA